MAVQAVRRGIITHINRLAVIGLPVGIDNIGLIVALEKSRVLMALRAQLHDIGAASELLHARREMAVKFLYERLVVMAGEATAHDSIGNSGPDFFKKRQGPVQRVLMAGLARGIILGIGLGRALFIYRAVHAGQKYFADLLMGKSFKISLLVKVALFQAVDLFSLFMGDVLNIGVAAAAVEQAVRAVLVNRLRYIQQAQRAVIINIAHAAVLVADKAVFHINGSCRCGWNKRGKQQQKACCAENQHEQRFKAAVFFNHRIALPHKYFLSGITDAAKTDGKAPCIR